MTSLIAQQGGDLVSSRFIKNQHEDLAPNKEEIHHNNIIEETSKLCANPWLWRSPLVPATYLAFANNIGDELQRCLNRSCTMEHSSHVLGSCMPEAIMDTFQECIPSSIIAVVQPADQIRHVEVGPDNRLISLTVRDRSGLIEDRVHSQSTIDDDEEGNVRKLRCL